MAWCVCLLLLLPLLVLVLGKLCLVPGACTSTCTSSSTNATTNPSFWLKISSMGKKRKHTVLLEGSQDVFAETAKDGYLERIQKKTVGTVDCRRKGHYVRSADGARCESHGFLWVQR